MSQRITVVDAFTHLAFRGNPAAVCVLSAPTTEAWMQQLAREMRHSETAFTVPLRDGRFELRWFTPTCEVKLCGHATLATAHVLWEEGRLATQDVARFVTLSGELTATPCGRVIELDFPGCAPAEAAPPEGLLEALGVEASWVGKNAEDWMVLLESEQAVRACRPKMGALAEIEARGVCVTAKADGASCDFVSRFFAPRFGIDEDPVTGSAHCALAPFWKGRLGKSVLRAEQLSERGGELEVEPVGERVKLRGTAVTTLRATLCERPPVADLKR